MSLWNRYLDIQKLKRASSLDVEGIDFARVVAVLLYDQTVFGRFKKLIFALFFKTEFLISSSGSKVDFLLVYSCRQKGRADYDYIYSYLCDTCSDRGKSVEAIERISFFHVFKVFFIYAFPFFLCLVMPGVCLTGCLLLVWWLSIGFR